ncbi:hypothetical protein LNTAR_19207 [Lentisphaera araneosa HTCC2155]|jgi:hypothetical protein|uniref:Uncharacterized protein n=1 Tax=Lentisphaera araneosa HTCC2155 TaxID=313628 RepID=A6DQQ7_9BACT|nr:hypothetical protein [Lentisphaera araneosa]EDM25957.1 hypothetical protein LNTAR_19207 [Lentisphaera araneosa HTCC2155]
MSRSYHQTHKSVLGGKSINQINEMITNDDPDLNQLVEKSQIKKDIKRKRKANRKQNFDQ